MAFPLCIAGAHHKGRDSGSYSYLHLHRNARDGAGCHDPFSIQASLVLKPVSYRRDTAFSVAPGNGCVCTSDKRHL